MTQKELLRASRQENFIGQPASQHLLLPPWCLSDPRDRRYQCYTLCTEAFTFIRRDSTLIRRFMGRALEEIELYDLL